MISSSTMSQLTGRLLFASLAMAVKRSAASFLSMSTCASILSKRPLRLFVRSLPHCRY